MTQVSLFQTGFIAACMLLLTACANPRPAIVDYDKTVDFSRYQTYAFYVPAEAVVTAESDKSEASKQAAEYHSLLDQHFKAAIEREMSALGYRLVADNPQLLVNYLSNVEQRTDVRSSPFQVSANYGYVGSRTGLFLGIPLFGRAVEQHEYKVGTVTIDLIDAAEQRLIWQGLLEGRLSNKALQQPQQAISNTVNQIYQRFPTRLPIE
ncbi:DUF4136 domain-containing protein [Arsukibacterium sp.]|uniref:DUF4136 domain-containing protein n=1 Tax=Arsukibacterium sp. TaxID=1977258 RepID=UPI002FD88BEE